MTDPLFIYELWPTDIWHGFVPLELYVSLARAESWDTPDQAERRVRAWAVDRLAALVRYSAWEGDFRDVRGPMVSALPGLNDDGWPDLMLTVKQDNNGTTFLASPVELVHLSEAEVYRRATRRPSERDA